MGRSSKEEAARTRARIVEAASKLFRASGVDRISVAGLMGALGLTTGGFYKHFASKEALVAEAVELAFEQSSSAWQEIAGRESEETPGRRSRLVQHYLRPHPQTRCPMIAFASHGASEDSGEASRDSYRQGAEALLERFVDSGREEDSARPPVAAERETMLLFAAMVGARMLEEAAGEASWARELCETVVDAAAAAT